MAKQDDPLPVETDEPDFDAAAEMATEEWKLQRTAQTNMRWEASVVKKILAIGGCPQAARELKRINAEETGLWHLYFARFLEAFPQFPLWLHCVKIPYVYKTEKEQLRKRAKSSMIYKAYKEGLEYVPEDRRDGPYALVFEWLHVGGQFQILHDMYRNTHARAELDHGYREEIIVEKGKSLHLDELTLFLATIGWTDQLAVS